MTAREETALNSLAYAMGGTGGVEPPRETSAFIIMMNEHFHHLYFLLIRPSQKKQKELKEMVAALGMATWLKHPGASTEKSSRSLTRW